MMSCVEAPFCGTFHLDSNTGFDNHMTSRIDMSQSGRPDELKEYYASGFMPKPGMENKVLQSMYPDQLNTETPMNILPPDLGTQKGASTLGSLPAPENSLNSASLNWNAECDESKALALTRFPSRDSLETESSISMCSNHSARIPSLGLTGTDNNVRLHSIDSPVLQSSPELEARMFADIQFRGEYHPPDQNSLDNISLSIPASYNMFCNPRNDPFSTVSYGIGIADPLNYNHPLSENTMWEENFIVSPKASLNDECSYSHLINSPISYSSSPRSSTSFIEDYSNRAECSSQSSTVKMKKFTGTRASKAGNELVVASKGSPVVGSEAFDSSMQLISRSSIELDNNAREHPLYHNVSPHADGLYHCPWENDSSSSCQHKPEKLKCNYDKFVDSHLKPYRCKVLACKDLHFSSTACLLRHEREAHAMHGHGDKPFLCKYEGCERGVPGNGFPRHWNLRDHMKRVHNDPGHFKTNVSGNSSVPSAHNKGRKRKASDVTQSFSKKISTPVTKEQIDLSLLDRYRQKHQNLLEIVNQLQDPKNMDNLILLRNANDCIKLMVQTTQRINSLSNSVMQVG